MTENQERFNRTLALFDAANAQDPSLDEGQPNAQAYALSCKLKVPEPLVPLITKEIS